jgi:hypothetical protein
MSDGQTKQDGSGAGLSTSLSKALLAAMWDVIHILDDAPTLDSIEPEAVNVNATMNNVYQVLMDAINAANVPHQARSDSGVALDAVVGNDGK